jgi:hypothetical protein
VANDMAFARAYNSVTNSNITHWDVRELGLQEETAISLAIEMMTENRKTK